MRDKFGRLLPSPDLQEHKHAFRALESAYRNLDLLDDALFRVGIQVESRETAAILCSAALDCLHACLTHIQKITPQ